MSCIVSHFLSWLITFSHGLYTVSNMWGSVLLCYYVFFLQDGATPLIIACAMGRLSVLKHLIAGKADVNHQTKVGYYCSRYSVSFSQHYLLPHMKLRSVDVNWGNCVKCAWPVMHKDKYVNMVGDSACKRTKFDFIWCLLSLMVGAKSWIALVLFGVSLCRLYP